MKKFSLNWCAVMPTTPIMLIQTFKPENHFSAEGTGHWKSCRTVSKTKTAAMKYDTRYMDSRVYSTINIAKAWNSQDTSLHSPLSRKILIHKYKPITTNALFILDWAYTGCSLNCTGNLLTVNNCNFGREAWALHLVSYRLWNSYQISWTFFTMQVFLVLFKTWW